MLTAEQLNNQMDEIVKFLSIVHPTLADGSDRKACVEIRPIARGVYEYKSSRSFCLWEFTENTLFLLEEFLKAHNGTGHCLYYSVFNFDYNKESFTKTGKKAQKGRITVGTARYVNEIAIDFDDITEEDALRYMQEIESVGINPLWTHSGYGYHAHLLLDRELWDRQALLQMVYLLRSRGFNADIHCIDAARIFRLPGTYNYKGFKEDPLKDFPLCHVVKHSEDRYSIDAITAAISTLPIRSDDDYETYLRVSQNNESADLSELNATVTVKDNINYPELVQSCLPEPVIKMLCSCEEGYRNATCGFLIKYFKQYYKLSREDIYSVMSRWAEEVCEPPFDLDECFDRFYKMGGLNYGADLAAKYGIIDFAHIKDRSIIWIPNELFVNFKNLSAPAVKMYLAIKKLEHNKHDTSLDGIMKALDLSHKPNARSVIKELIANKFVFEVKGKRKLGEPNRYYTQRIISISQGQTRFSYNDIASYVRDLQGNEIKLYMYMKYKCFRTGNCFMSQSNLGKATGYARTAAMFILRQLANKEYLEIEKTYVTEHVAFCNYTLLR